MFVLSKSVKLLANNNNTVAIDIMQVAEQACSKNYKAIFTQWITEHDKMLRHIIAGFEMKPSLQEELFQEIALNVWKALPSFKSEAKSKTFVARIAHNVLATHVAKSVRTVKESTTSEILEQKLDDSATPYQALDKEQRQQRLASAIRQLSFEQQQIVTLALEGMSYQDIADVTGISTNLVGVRLNRAKAALMALLEK